MKRALSQEHLEHLFVQLAGIWLVAHGQIKPCLLIDYRLDVGKRFEYAFAVIRPHAGLSHAAKAHLAGCQMDDHIVDASAAVLQLARNAVLVRCIA